MLPLDLNQIGQKEFFFLRTQCDDCTFPTTLSCQGIEKFCDSIDFNNDGSLFDITDVDAFLSVFSEGPCIPAQAVCNDIDFNNDGSFFDYDDIDSFLSVTPKARASDSSSTTVPLQRMPHQPYGAPRASRPLNSFENGMHTARASLLGLLRSPGGVSDLP